MLVLPLLVTHAEDSHIHPCRRSHERVRCFCSSRCIHPRSLCALAMLMTLGRYFVLGARPARQQRTNEPQARARVY